MKPRWRKEQHRYRQILREIKKILFRFDHFELLNKRINLIKSYGTIRALRRATPEFFERNAIDKTREDARAISALTSKLSLLLSQTTLSPELRMRLEPELEIFLTKLEAIKSHCLAADKNQPPNDQVRQWCVSIAFTLVFRFSGKLPTSGSYTSPYREIASLLYEVVAAKKNRDLRRACDSHLKAMRAIG